MVLETFGYAVIDASDGDDAVARFLQNRDRIHLVMLDVIMPKMGGREAGERIRKARPDVRILYISGYTADRIDPGALREEGVHFIHKPVAPRQLLEKVRQVLDG
jgi:CheY-like chemotaxis protein